MDKYVRGKVLGKGSFGSAVLVENKVDGKKYVIKEIDISRMPKAERQAAEQEAKLLMALNHPNIVSCRECFTHQSKLCIVMDWCSEGDLYGILQKRRGAPLPEDTVLDWLVQMCLGLKHVHDRKILHRDMKTQNVFMSAGGLLKLGDFGVSKVLHSTWALAATAVGTPYYLSPEICQNKKYNQKSDIWSLGCVLYEIATGKHAFEAPNMRALIQKIIKGQFPPLPSTRSKELRDLIASMLTLDSKKRPSINDVLATPIMKSRITKWLSATLRQNEFSHTIIHGKPQAGKLVVEQGSGAAGPGLRNADLPAPAFGGAGAAPVGPLQAALPVRNAPALVAPAPAAGVRVGALAGRPHVLGAAGPAAPAAARPGMPPRPPSGRPSSGGAAANPYSRPSSAASRAEDPLAVARQRAQAAAKEREDILRQAAAKRADEEARKRADVEARRQQAAAELESRRKREAAEMEARRVKANAEAEAKKQREHAAAAARREVERMRLDEQRKQLEGERQRLDDEKARLAARRAAEDKKRREMEAQQAAANAAAAKKREEEARRRAAMEEEAARREAARVARDRERDAMRAQMAAAKREYQERQAAVAAIKAKVAAEDGPVAGGAGGNGYDAQRASPMVRPGPAGAQPPLEVMMPKKTPSKRREWSPPRIPAEQELPVVPTPASRPQAPRPGGADPTAEERRRAWEEMRAATERNKRQIMDADSKPGGLAAFLGVPGAGGGAEATARRPDRAPDPDQERVTRSKQAEPLSQEQRRAAYMEMKAATERNRQQAAAADRVGGVALPPSRQSREGAPAAAAARAQAERPRSGRPQQPSAAPPSSAPSNRPSSGAGAGSALDPWERKKARLEEEARQREAEILEFQRQHWRDMRAAAARNKAQVLGDLVEAEAAAGGAAGGAQQPSRAQQPSSSVAAQQPAVAPEPEEGPDAPLGEAELEFAAMVKDMQDVLQGTGPKPAAIGEEDEEEEEDDKAGGGRGNGSLGSTQQLAMAGRFMLNGKPLMLPVRADDSLALKVEALRMYLEEKLGTMPFLKVYQRLEALSVDDDEAAVSREFMAVLGADKLSYLQLVHQLIVCEENMNMATGN